MNDKRNLFENMGCSKAILTLAVPTIVSQLINVIYNIADTFYVGRTGDPYMIAGVSVVLPLFVMTIPISNIFGIGGGSLIARMMGCGDDRNTATVSAFCFYATAAGILIYSLVVFFFEKGIFAVLGVSDNTWLYASQYTFYVVIIGSVPNALSMVQAHLLRNVGYSKQAGIGLSGGGILNIILDPVFMFVLFPKGNEVLAASVATLISNVITCIYMTYVMVHICGKTGLSVKISDACRINRTLVKSVVSVGLPAGFLLALFDVSQIFFNSLMASFGDLELAANGIIQKLERVASSIGVGLSQGMMPLISYNYASGNRQRMNDIIRTGRRMGIIQASVCSLCAFLASPLLCGVFLTGSGASAVQTISFASSFLKIRCILPIMMFLNYSASYAMQAIGWGRGAMIHVSIRIIVLNIPIMYIFSSLFGSTGLAVAFPVSEALSAVIASLMLKRGIDRK